MNNFIILYILNKFSRDVFFDLCDVINKILSDNIV